MKVYEWWAHEDGDEADPTAPGMGYHGGFITVVAESVEQARELAKARLSRKSYDWSSDTDGKPESVDREPDRITDTPCVVSFDEGFCCR